MSIDRKYQLNQSGDEADPDTSLIQLVEELEAVEEDTAVATLNKTSISDNRGGRIKLNDKLAQQNKIQGVE